MGPGPGRGGSLYTVYEGELGPIGVLVWLFNKKTCPKCRGDVKRKREVELKEGNPDKALFSGPTIYDVKHNFVCENCGAKLTFDEVRRQKKK